MKRFTCLKTLFVALLMLVSANVLAYDFEYEGVYYSIISTSELTCAVVKGNVEYSGEVIIPEVVEYKDRQLTPIKIEECAFKDCAGLNNVKTNRSISAIGDSAFQGCVNLQALTLHSAITDIGKYAFAGCINLEDPNIVNTSITTISEHMFDGCSKLTEVLMPKTIIWISEYAFNNCVGLIKFTFPNASDIPSSWQPSIHQSAFAGCTNLKDLVFEDSDRNLSFSQSSNEKSIKAFKDCPIETVYLGRVITTNSYENLPFNNKPSLRYIEINAPKELEPYTFYGCTNLESVLILDDVPSIPKYCFTGCSNLSTVYIGNNVKLICDYAFKGCSNLESLMIPNNIVELGEDAFAGCTGLKNLEFEDGDEPITFVSTSSDFAMKYSYMFKDSSIEYLYLGRNFYYGSETPFSGISTLNQIVVGNTVKSIPAGAFADCSKLVRLTIGSSVEKIGSNALSGCLNLSTIISLNPTPPEGAGDLGLTTEQYTGDVMVYVPEGTLQSYLNDGGWKSFWDIRETDITAIPVLVNVEKPGTLNNFLNFINWWKITKIKVTGRINSIDLQQLAFLTSYASINYIDLSEAKVVAEGGTSTVTEDNVIGPQCFYYGAEENQSKLETIIFPKSLKRLEMENFERYYDKLSNVVFGDELVYIGGWNFMYTNLQSINLPSSLEECGRYAFSQCKSNIESVIIPGSLRIVSFAMFQLTKINSVELLYGVEIIDTCAFDQCDLKKVIIPASVEKIEADAFRGNLNLSELHVKCEEPPYAVLDEFLDKSYWPFDKKNFENTILYVPKGCVEKYKNADCWKEFKNIVEEGTTAISNVTTSKNAVEIARYSIDGKRLSAPQKGLNIVVMSDGSKRKVLVK